MNVLSSNLILKLNNGKLVQRPLSTVENNIIVAMLAEHDNKSLKVFPIKDTTFKNGKFL